MRPVFQPVSRHRAPGLVSCILAVGLGLLAAGGALGQTITNLYQFQIHADALQQSNIPVRLRGVIRWCENPAGLVVMQDGSGAALMEMDQPPAAGLQPGQEIMLEGGLANGTGGARLRMEGLELHADLSRATRTDFGSLHLKAGRHPFEILFFRKTALAGFDLFYEGPNLPRQLIPDSLLLHAVTNTDSQSISWRPGVDYALYRGNWRQVPDLRGVPPVTTGVASNFSLASSELSGDEALVFRGCLNALDEGTYGFSLALPGRAPAVVANPRIQVVGSAELPRPSRVVPGQILADHRQSFWGETEGTISFLSRRPASASLELKAENGTMHVEIRRGGPLPYSLLLGARVHLTGLCYAAHNSAGQLSAGSMWLPDFNSVELLDISPQVWARQPIASIGSLRSLTATNPADLLVHLFGRVITQSGRSVTLQDKSGTIVLNPAGRILATNGDYIEVLGTLRQSPEGMTLENAHSRKTQAISTAANPLPVLTSVEEIKRLNRHDALKGFPVNIRGVVTWSGGSGFVIQDATMGVFAELVGGLSSGPVRAGDFVEIRGITTNQFSPMVLVQGFSRIGLGTYPEPVDPTWDQLMNGTLDTQYAEVRGSVIAVDGNSLVLLMPDGTLKIDLPEMQHQALTQYADALVTIRGCLWAAKNEVSHVLTPGEIFIHNPSVSVDQAAPADLFSAPLKRVSELLLFDAKASALQRVRVTGQIIHHRDQEFYLMDGAKGLRLYSRTNVSLKAGDLVEAVGFPVLGGPSPILREAAVRQIGATNLPAPEILPPDRLLAQNRDSTLVQVRGRLASLSEDQAERILEIESGPQMFAARISRKLGPVPAPLNSIVDLTGVYSVRDLNSFELLLNSPADIQLVQRPPWWTIRRMLAVVGTLAGVLAFAGIWIGLLHRQVEQRTAQLEKEITARQQIERQRAIEAERARIARDLHDDLGASLTEISLLADAGAGTPASLDRAGHRFHSIGSKARAVVNALDIIVWLVNPQKDVLPFLVSYLGSYAEDYLNSAGIACRLKISPDIPAVRLSAQIRHNLFMATKEALNNIVRHSQATDVGLRIEVTDHRLTIAISDNGRGLAQPPSANGNGLINLDERMNNIGGRFEMESQPGTGTTILFSLPLPTA